MTDGPALQKLFTWLSPAFPVGAFAWSAGLETAIAERRVTNSAGLRNWLEGALVHGGTRIDAILLAHAHRRHGDAAQLTDLADLCLALTPSAERHSEVTTTGQAFILAARAWPSGNSGQLPDPCPYPIAVGAIAASHGIGLDETLLGYVTAAVHSQISVAVRLVPLGQTDGLTVMAKLEGQIAALARAAATSGLDAIGSIAYAADIAQMRHETLEPRIFRS